MVPVSSRLVYMIQTSEVFETRLFLQTSPEFHTTALTGAKSVF